MCVCEREREGRREETLSKHILRFNLGHMRLKEDTTKNCDGTTDITWNGPGQTGTTWYHSKSQLLF